MHSWRIIHYAADGTVTRQCSECLVRRIERPASEPVYRLLSRVQLAREPVCVAILHHRAVA